MTQSKKETSTNNKPRNLRIKISESRKRNPRNLTNRGIKMSKSRGTKPKSLKIQAPIISREATKMLRVVKFYLK
jgi:hypothetical protein